MTAGSVHSDADWTGRAALGVLVLCAVLAAVLEALLVPLYIGGVIFPIAVVLAMLSNIALPRLARAAVASTAAAVAPFAVWLIVMLGFGLVARPEGDVILPGGPLQWVTYGVLFGGALAGVVSIVTSAPMPQPAPRPSTGSPARR